MDFFHELFLLPNAHHLHLIKILLMIVYFVHVPYISLVIGSTLYSLIFLLMGGESDGRYRLFARHITEELLWGRWAGVILGVLPLLVKILIEGQIFYDAPIPIVPFLSYMTIFAVVGLSLVYAYKAAFRWREVNPLLHLLLGAGGLGLLTIAYLLFAGCTTLELDPGRWFLVKHPSQLFFSWNVVARFVQFFTAALAFSAAAIYFFFFHWQVGRKDMDESYRKLVRGFSLTLAFLFTLIQPVFLLWNLVTLPGISMSLAVFVLAALVIGVLALICLKLWDMLQQPASRHGIVLFALYGVAFVLVVVTDHYARENAIENHTALLTTRAEEILHRLEAEREAMRASSIKVDLELGKQVFDNQCSTCHRFDKQLVGPAYNSVLPKYLEQKEKLIQFIRKPQKINPNLPPMPQLGLKESEIRSVAEFLIQTYQQQHAGSKNENE